MPLTLGRGAGPAEVVIDHGRCTLCKLCLQVCKGQPLYLDGDRIGVDQSRWFGCIGCAHCMCVCPVGCIQVTGRDLSPADLMPISDRTERASFAQLEALMLSRRSVREFQDKDVPSDVVQQIIEAASTAPMGVPPSEVCVKVWRGRPAVRELRDDMLAEMAKSRWFFSPVMMALLRPFIGKEGHEGLKQFVKPAIEIFATEAAAGRDMLTYDAPLGLYFYGTPYSETADLVIAATYAMLAAETLGLGSCMLGFPGMVIGRSKRLKLRWGMDVRSKPGLMLIVGHPKFRFQRAVRRRFAVVEG